MNSLQSLVACAQRNGLTLCDINGHINFWCNTCRDSEGRTPSSDQFRAEWERQLTLRSQEPINSFEESE